MSFIEDFKNFIERAKRKFGISWQKLLDQIPDQDRLESYRFDEVLEKMVLKSKMPEPEIPILDENRNLKVVFTNYYEYEGYITVDDAEGTHRFPIELDFMADSITIVCYYMLSGKTFNLNIYYLITKGVAEPETITLYTDNGMSSTTVNQTDCKPYKDFLIIFNKTDADARVKFKIIFSKQKKTKISDAVYDESTWDAVIDVGASKNAIRDKIEALATLIGLNTTVAEVEAIITAELVEGQSIDNAIDTLISAIDYLTEAEILALTWLESDITDLDHLTEVEALAYVNATGLVLASTKVITSADENLSFIFGRCALGSPANDIMYLAHRDNLTTSSYAIWQLSGGSTSINAKAGATLYFRVNNAELMTLIATLLTINVPIAMATNKITGCGNPVNDQDVVTKKYVVDNFLAIAHYHDSHTLQLDAINSDGGNFEIKTSGIMEFKVNGDNDDYLVFMTDSGIPYIYAFGGDIIYFRSGTAGNWEVLHADDFVNETPPMPTELCTESILNVKNTIDGILDKKSLPKDVYYADKNGKNEGMKLGAMVLHLTKTIQELESRIKDLEKNN